MLMRPRLEGEAFLTGVLRDGTREFSGLTGKVTERWIANSKDSEFAPVGRLELSTQFVAILEEAVEDES